MGFARGHGFSWTRFLPLEDRSLRAACSLTWVEEMPMAEGGSQNIPLYCCIYSCDILMRCI